MDNTNFVIEDDVLEEFYDNDENVTIPDGVIIINDFSFAYCKSLSINMPNSVIKIGDDAFAHCKSLSNINIPNSVIAIGDRAFAYCPLLETLNIPSSVISIGEDAFLSIKPIKRPHPIDGKLIAYKAFNKDWTCRGFQYEIGKSYHQKGKIECCRKGFHACLNPLDIFTYYWGYLSRLHLAEVELSGIMDECENMYETKVAASDIRIIRELTVSELAAIYNSMEKC